jgi:hypothetical protein
VDALFGRACALVEDHDVYIGVCARIRPQGRAEDVKHAPGFWADLDFTSFADGEPGALQKQADFPIRPTWIIATSRGVPPVLETDRSGAAGCEPGGPPTGRVNLIPGRGFVV